ncbi:hypothetical protein [Sphingomonas sp.]|uniref:hypothetical protein n=1 Tax=Sphingomonas sp. TaxID=28214 RepID=UPI0017D8F3C5|nr:hypothetical protein [Sphingomonas sp.]MBA4762977.1 hypothetical protein [Sphingomonas sp.]
MKPQLTEAEAERARMGLTAAVDRFPLAVKLLQRSLFRQHLALNVGWATPLIGIVSRVEGLDFDESAWSIAPPRGWPERPLPTDARATSIGIERGFDLSPARIWRRHRLAGVIVRSSRRSDDVIGMRVLGDGIELTALDGALKIETYHGLGRILLEQSLPATLAIAARGRFIADLVAHRWLEETRWPILRVAEGDGGTAITFQTGRVPWAAPWPVVWQAKPGEEQ